MIYLSLDISSVSTGYCAYDGYKLLGYGKIVPSKKFHHGQKLVHLEKELDVLYQTYLPDELIIEQVWAGNNISTLKILSLYHGVVYKRWYELSKKVVSVLAPSECRKLVGDKHGKKLNGKRKDAKLAVFNFATAYYNLSGLTLEKDDDITDAIVIAMAGSIRKENERSLPNPSSPKGNKQRRSKKSLQEASDAISS